MPDLLSRLSTKKLPTSIRLNAVDRDWSVSVVKGAVGSQAQIKFIYPDIEFSAPPRKRVDWFPLYRRFMLEQAKELLTPWLQRLSEECGLPFSGVGYGYQKTLWGSCSSKKKINLNAKLLYLPPRLVQYVLIHELCHTRHMNHQPEFWSLVEQFEADYRDLRRQLRHGGQYIPILLNR